ncbi:MAG: nucleotidyltransferase family protein [Prolixibacteraceae bacterium]
MNKTNRMKAFIFAAGLGTRLQPLTNNCPKALVELNGKPLLWYAITKLLDAGISEIIINIHHFGDQIIEYISTHDFGIPIYISDERESLLDTGGALPKAAHFFQNSSPIVIYNVDVISSVNLRQVIFYHKQNQPLATLVVRDRVTSRYLLFDEELQLSGWKNYETGEEKISRSSFINSCDYAFSGIQVISPELFPLIQETGKFSIIDLYLRLAKEHPIMAYIDRSDIWIDLGKKGQLLEAEKHLSQLGY